MVVSEYKICFRDTENCGKGYYKEYTSIGTNKTAGTFFRPCPFPKTARV